MERLRAGILGLSVVGLNAFGLGALGLGVAAQPGDALAQELQSQAAQSPATQSPATQECSGLGCLFHWHLGDSSPPASAQQPASEALGATSERASARTTVKPASLVTIAADPMEVARLKGLAAGLPTQKIKILKIADESERARSDFSVSTSLATPTTKERTRLFAEQLHIVAGGAIHSVEDLDGKVVSFGADKSGNQVAARKAFEALNIRVQETPLDLDNALDGLASGDVDAVVVLAPQPIARLNGVTSPGVHLVSWPEGGALPGGASTATIDAATYPNLVPSGETIRALAIDATLDMSPKGEKDAAAKTFLKALSRNSDALSKRGFELLKVDLDARKARDLASADRSK